MNLVPSNCNYTAGPARSSIPPLKQFVGLVDIPLWSPDTWQRHCKLRVVVSVRSPFPPPDRWAAAGDRVPLSAHPCLSRDMKDLVSFEFSLMCLLFGSLDMLCFIGRHYVRQHSFHASVRRWVVEGRQELYCLKVWVISKLLCVFIVHIVL